MSAAVLQRGHGGWINSNSRCKHQNPPESLRAEADLHTDGDSVLAGLRLRPGAAAVLGRPVSEFTRELTNRSTQLVAQPLAVE